jgi:SPOR domain
MDQNTTGGTDKRNWRERLGIGTKDTGMKDMPRVTEEFKPAPPTTKPAGSAVRPAPMAPRIVAKTTPQAAAPIARPAAIAPDALANKLKSQRDAAEKLAEQRVFAARQRAEAAMVQSTPMVNAPKPKFSFADEDAKTAKPASVPQVARPAQVQQPTQRPPALPPQAPGGYSPQMVPPRPPLGGGAAIPPRVQPPQAYPQGQAYGQQQPAPYPPNYSQQGYAPPPPYRPIDPATGYAPPPPFNPAPSFNPQPRPPYGNSNGQQQPPRLQVPPRGQPAAGYGYEEQARPNARPVNAAPSRAPSGYGESDGDDIFEQPVPTRGQRRATANDYQQAYREVESGYEDDAPRSRLPWIMALLVVGVVAAVTAYWAYGNYIKPQLAAGSTQSIPVVKAPETPAKIVPDAAVEAQPAAAGQTVQPTKKQIYDRIVGDREVLGGQIVPTEEAPVQPLNSTQPAAVPDPAATPATTGTGNDGTPLPLPPPPGDTTNGTQGSLEPSGKSDQQLATITPAAGASSPAADSSPVVPAVPVPGEPPKAVTAAPVHAPAAVTPSSAKAPTQVANAAPAETIQDTAEPVAPVEKKVKVAVLKKVIAKSEKNLGSKPVVLVPPAKKTSAVRTAESTEAAPIDSGGLYGDTVIGDTAVADNTVATTQEKKRRTLLDLFRKNDNADASTGNEVQPIVKPKVATGQQVAAATPPPAAQQSTGNGAYVAQLASFKSKSEASQEYARMKAKHGEIVGRYAPIVSQAQVAGTTRYRLNIGPMASADVATSLCRSLIAAGERDCLVHRQ